MATKELTVQERADKALTIEHTEEKLALLAAKTSDINEITDDATYELVKRGALVLRDVRVDIEKVGKAARDDANLFSKAVIAKQKDLVGIIKGEEDRLKAMRKEVDDEEQRKADEIRKREEERMAVLEQKITDIRQRLLGVLDLTAEQMQERIDAVSAIDPTLFQEYAEAAQATKLATLQQLQEAHDSRVALDAQKADQDRVAAEQAEAQANLDAQAAEQKEAQDKIDEERAEAARIMQEGADKAAAEKAEAEEAERQAERDEAARVLAEKEELERKAAEQEAADKKAAREEKARLKKLAAAPDLDKLELYGRALLDVQIPKLKDGDCKITLGVVVAELVKVVDRCLPK